jgi:hypothetical protein
MEMEARDEIIEIGVIDHSVLKEQEEIIEREKLKRMKKEMKKYEKDRLHMIEKNLVDEESLKYKSRVYN